MDALDPTKLTDREVLLLVSERQSVMGIDIKELKDGTSKELAAITADISHLKELKADKSFVEQLDRKQQRLFNYLWFAFGASAILQVIVPLVIKSLWH